MRREHAVLNMWSLITFNQMSSMSKFGEGNCGVKSKKSWVAYARHRGDLWLVLIGSETGKNKVSSDF